MTCYPTCPLQRAIIAGMQARAALAEITKTAEIMKAILQ